MGSLPLQSRVNVGQVLAHLHQLLASPSVGFRLRLRYLEPKAKGTSQVTAQGDQLIRLAYLSTPK